MARKIRALWKWHDWGRIISAPIIVLLQCVSINPPPKSHNFYKWVLEGNSMLVALYFHTQVSTGTFSLKLRKLYISHFLDLFLALCFVVFRMFLSSPPFQLSNREKQATSEKEREWEQKYFQFRIVLAACLPFLAAPVYNQGFAEFSNRVSQFFEKPKNLPQNKEGARDVVFLYIFVYHVIFEEWDLIGLCRQYSSR